MHLCSTITHITYLRLLLIHENYSLRICYVPSTLVSAEEAVVYKSVKLQFSLGGIDNLIVSKHIIDIISESK